MNARELAILASAYNVCGPRQGQPATPATVLAMADRATLRGYAMRYAEHVARDPDALYTPREASSAAAAV